MSAQAPILVCPLQFERRCLLKTGLGNSYTIETCGPGREGVARWVGAHRNPGRPVVMVGLAGSLVKDHAVGDVVEVEAVVAAGGKRIETNWALPEELGTPRVRATSKTRAITSRPGKRSLHAVTTADIVDMESQAFAEHAVDLGWEFGIVRAISDGLDDPLPPGCDNWVDHKGRAAPLAIASSIMRSPTVVRRMRSMQKDGEHAMFAVAQVFERARFAEQPA